MVCFRHEFFEIEEYGSWFSGDEGRDTALIFIAKNNQTAGQLHKSKYFFLNQRVLFSSRGFPEHRSVIRTGNQRPRKSAPLIFRILKNIFQRGFNLLVNATIKVTRKSMQENQTLDFMRVHGLCIFYDFFHCDAFTLAPF